MSRALSPRVVRLPLDPTSGVPLPSPQADGGGYPSTVLGGAGGCVVVVVDSNGNSYTSCSQDQRLHSIGYDANAGTLFSRGSATVGASPIAVAAHPNGNFAYSAIFSSGSLRTFTVGAAAGPTAVTPPLAINASCRTLAFDPTNANRLFAGCDFEMLTLSVDGATGLPTLLGSAPRSRDSAYSLVVVNPAR